MKTILWLAAVYNILWGMMNVLFPYFFFDFAEMAPPTYPELWQCIAMIVGVYGVGYGIAATDPVRHWPITLVGLLGKVFGPIGFTYAYFMGTFTLKAGMFLVFNDLIWWIPFSIILYRAYNHYKR